MATPAATARGADAPQADPPGARLADAIDARLADAARQCRARGAQLTTQRREVLELLLRRGGTAKAYDLQDDMRQRHGRVAPTTIYRALDFLMAQGLVHRVDALNTFVACNDAEHADHQPLFLVCSSCQAATELHDHAMAAAIARTVRAAGAGFRQTAVEIKGQCQRCQQAD